MDSGLSTGDLALMDRNNNDWGGSSFMWIFALLILAGGGFGFGNRGMGMPQNVATQEDVQNGFNFAALERQNNETVAAVRQGVYDTTGAVKDANYNTLGEIRDLQDNVGRNFTALTSEVTNGFTNMQKCCCDIERAIDGVNYNSAINTANINANTTAQVQKVLDAISTNRMNDMQNQINQLQLQNAMSGVVRYPMATAYSSGNNPFCGCNCSGI